MLCAGGFALTAAAGAAYFSQTTSEPSVADDLRAYVSYALLSQPRLVDVAKRVVVWLHEHGLSFVYARPLKATLYRQFCGRSGETTKETVGTIEALHARGVHVILNHCVERDNGPHGKLEGAASKVADTLTAVGIAGHSPGNAVAVKISGMTDPTALQTLSAELASTPTLAQFTGAVNSSSLLSACDKASLLALHANLWTICEKCHRLGVKLLVDAEQTYMQPAIDLLTLDVSSHFNRDTSLPIVYNTYQMYTKRAPQAMREHLLLGRSHGFSIGIKLVRGAYLGAEGSLRRQLFQDSKQATDSAYDDALRYLLQGEHNFGLIVATHNAESCRLALALLAEQPLRQSFTGFAQLYGMCDDLTASIARELPANTAVFKYMPYGTVDETMPYLIRRIDENSHMLDRARDEKRLAAHALWQRLLSVFS